MAQSHVLQPCFCQQCSPFDCLTKATSSNLTELRCGTVEFSMGGEEIKGRQASTGFGPLARWRKLLCTAQVEMCE